MMRWNAENRSTLFVGVASVLLLTALSWPALVHALPPRPTPEPTTEPTLTPTEEPRPDHRPRSKGGEIELALQFSPKDLDGPWQELWTVVQWQDPDGTWHDVEGWRGTLDEVKGGADGRVVGRKAWWVAESDLGKGPFRWVIAERKGGDVLVLSEPFDLPTRARETLGVEVSLSQ